jgi:TetR/AcrR family transcriptional repressor of nem operon
MTKAEKTRQYIIEQTAPIFNTKGIAATAISDIMEATKMAKGSLYVHFENKEELAYYAVDHNLNDFFNKAAIATNDHRTAKGKFFAFLDFLSDPVNHPIAGGCPMLNFGAEADDTSPVILEKVRLAMEDAQRDIAKILEDGILDGEFKKGWDTKEFATKVFAMLEGGVLISRVYGSSASMKVLINILKREIEEKLL